MENLIESTILSQKLTEYPQKVTEEETQRMLVVFRRAYGLLKAEDLKRWLHETGLTLDSLKELLNEKIALRKLKDFITEPRIKNYFREHKSEFERYTLSAIHGLNLKEAERTKKWLLKNKEKVFLPGSVKIQLFKYELPCDPQDAEKNKIVGPYRRENSYSLFLVIRKTRAKLDKTTRRVIKDRIFKDWISEERRKSKIEWHWF